MTRVSIAILQSWGPLFNAANLAKTHCPRSFLPVTRPIIFYKSDLWLKLGLAQTEEANQLIKPSLSQFSTSSSSPYPNLFLLIENTIEMGRLSIFYLRLAGSGKALSLLSRPPSPVANPCWGCTAQARLFFKNEVPPQIPTDDRSRMIVSYRRLLGISNYILGIAEFHHQNTCAHCDRDNVRNVNSIISYRTEKDIEISKQPCHFKLIAIQNVFSSTYGSGLRQTEQRKDKPLRDVVLGLIQRCNSKKTTIFVP